MALPKALENYRQFYRKIKTFQDIGSVLHWDSEVMMPPSGREYRAKQIAEISGLTHEWTVGPEYKDLIEKAVQSLSEVPQTQKSLWEREFSVLEDERKKAEKLPAEFVTEFSETTNLAHAVWAEAKKNQKFSDFSEILEKIVGLSRKQADYIGYTTEPYDVLLDSYEKDAKASEIDQLFQDLKKELVPIVESAPYFESPFSSRTTSKEKQEKLCKRLPPLLGLSFDVSRLDVSHHPFSTSLGKADKRITTRYSESDPLSSIFGVLHETGHSLYEAGLSEIEDWPSPLTEFLSLGIHESQSRLWENQVGRSRSFWEFLYPILISDFGLTEKDISFTDLYKSINSTKKSKIRVEADQVTYNLHIILRFEIERDLINGKIKVKDLPELWNSKVKEYLGLKIENDSEGVLQDIHWSMGGFGYFPTYTLGNIFSSQFFAAFEKETSGYQNSFAKDGDFSSLLKWLRSKIHHQGKIQDVNSLVSSATGESPNAKYLIQYLKSKVSEVGTI
ncbi:carboxypeptidase M32 [Leptospira idonii]|uniref:Metal-dependent carboxypeptidase n=1 Tax=Leptospira idonii TaxID=1193500 RepID=A0A4R9LVL7_9LEPT|nr:carboxypeptidase M32 [Leptospira idonii]TGN17053.1 carboxypeptidase M32 [Leptospira idonii]